MFHQDFVGHFDPRDAFDLQTRERKPLWPVSREAFEQTLACFDAAVAQCISYCAEGWVVCDWTGACCHRHRTDSPHRLSQMVRDFARTLAENDGAMVLTEMHLILFPAGARRGQEVYFAELAAQRQSQQ